MGRITHIGIAIVTMVTMNVFAQKQIYFDAWT